MPARLHILTASPRLAPHEALLRDMATKTLDRIGEIIAVPDVDIAIADNPDDAIPETGFGGYAPTPHLLYIYIDGSRQDIAAVITRELPSTLAHELAHCVRLMTHNFHSSLLEQVIAEGLGDHFDIQVTSASPRPWDTCLSDAELATALDRFQKEQLVVPFDSHAWLFGSEALGIKKWTTYALGYALVGAYLRQTGKQASDILAEDPGVIAAASFSPQVAS